MFLDDIVKNKREEIETEFTDAYVGEIIKNTVNNEYKGKFRNALNTGNAPAVIAEIKKASPSKGIINERSDIAYIANEYGSSEIDAISVLTETKYFMGHKKNIGIVKQETKKPILRKDFIIDIRQIYESAYLGADAVLLIAAILSVRDLLIFLDISKRLGMDCIVEIHDEKDLEKALYGNAKIIGINNRDLYTFEVSLDTTSKLMLFIPEDVLVVSESGISDNRDMQRLKGIGVRAVLIGEALMRAQSIHEKIRSLRYGD